MIPDWETNAVYFSDLLQGRHPKLWAVLSAKLQQAGIPCHVIRGTHDIWCRDCMPIQVDGSTFCQFVYSPDYLRGYEDLITPAATCRLANMKDYNTVPLVVDGGNALAGRGRVIFTDKIYRENPGRKRSEIRKMLEAAFQAQVIIIPKEPYDPIGHADGVVRFVSDDVVVINGYSAIDPSYGQKLMAVLKKHGLEVAEIPYFQEKRTTAGMPSAVGNYVNYLRVGNLVFAPAYGVAADDVAHRRLASLLPGVEVVPVDCCRLAREGGVLNCVSWTTKTRRR